MSKKDRDTSKLAWLKETQKQNPAAGISGDFRTTKQVDQDYLVEINAEMEKASSDNTNKEAKEACMKIYGVSEEEAIKFVEKCTEVQKR